MINTKNLLGQRIDASDGHIGSVHDVYFDEQTWSVRYLVIDTGKWLPGRKVLVVPEAIVNGSLTTEQVRSSPDIDTAAPISRLAEEELHRHYQWMPYWDISMVPVPPPPAPPVSVSSEDDRREAETKAEAMSEGHLRSARDTRGYHVQASDGDVGKLDEFVLDDDCSRILFLAVDVKDGWFGGKEVLVSPRQVSRVDWASLTIYLDATRQSIKAGQEYHPAA